MIIIIIIYRKPIHIHKSTYIQHTYKPCICVYTHVHIHTYDYNII